SRLKPLLQDAAGLRETRSSGLILSVSARNLGTMTTHPASDAPEGVTLGILAGGRATRLGGRDKAWIERGGRPLVLALAARLAPEVDATIVSANRNAERYLAQGLPPVADRTPDPGPLGRLAALAAASTT